jgi:hypothetical protein
MVADLRAYGVAIVLVLGAVVCLVFGSTSRAALAGAGFALLGAALTRAVDVTRERRAAHEKESAERARDLHETRRLCYAMLMKNPGDDAPMLTATLVNALVHYGLGIHRKTAMENIYPVGLERTWDMNRWLTEQIDRISAILDGVARA